MHRMNPQIPCLLVFKIALALSGFAAAQNADQALADQTLADQTSAVQTSIELSTSIERFQNQLAELESQYGPYSRNLLEPLQGLIELAQSHDDYTSVGKYQDRQLHVLRTEVGFRDPELSPLIKNIIANQIRLQNWEDVSDRLEYLRFLIAGDDETASPAFLEVMDQQAYWHLARVYLDEPERRAANFMSARDHFKELLDLAEDIYGKDSPELIPWLYKSAMSEYRLVEVINAEDGFAFDTVDRLVQKEGVERLRSHTGAVNLALELNSSFSPYMDRGNRIPIVNEGELVGEAYLRDAQTLIKDIGRIAEESGDKEAMAMSLIYEGDFQRLMDHGNAASKYREAQELLLVAGVPQEKIDQLFSQPTVIPVPQFHLRLDDALASQRQRVQGIESYIEGQLHLGEFVAWQEGVPDVPVPLTDVDYLEVELAFNQVDATLSVSSSGRISGVDIIAAVPDERRIEREAYRALRDIQVRPVIVNGRAKRTRDIHIRYFYLAQD